MEARTDPQLHNSKKKKRKISKVDATIEMLKEKQEKNAPIIGYYPSGFDPLKRKEPDSNNLLFYRNQKKLRRVEFIVKPNESEVDYVGSDHSSEAAAGGMNSFALGVLNKGSQSFRIVPISANKIFGLQPLARASHVSDKEPETPAKVDDAEDIKIKKRIL